MSNNDNAIKVVRSIIQVLHDGQKGLAATAAELKDEQARRFLLEQSQLRAEFAAELENELHRLGVPDVNEGGTTVGTAQRIWGDLKAKFGAGDHSLLETVEEGEDETKHAYADALEKNMLPGNVAELLRSQEAQILTSHNWIRSFRDGSAA